MPSVRSTPWPAPIRNRPSGAVRDGIEYADFPTVEWTLYTSRTPGADTPILENIQSLDMTLAAGRDGEFLLHHNVGSPANGNDYGPLETPLGANATKQLGGGRASDQYRHVVFQCGVARRRADRGRRLAGTMGRRVARDEARGLHLQAGQELTHFKLLPGEEVRTPLIVLQFWKAATGSLRRTSGGAG